MGHLGAFVLISIAAKLDISLRVHCSVRGWGAPTQVSTSVCIECSCVCSTVPLLVYTSLCVPQAGVHL